MTGMATRMNDSHAIGTTAGGGPRAAIALSTLAAMVSGAVEALAVWRVRAIQRRRLMELDVRIAARTPCEAKSIGIEPRGRRQRGGKAVLAALDRFPLKWNSMLEGGRVGVRAGADQTDKALDQIVVGRITTGDPPTT